MGTGADDAFDLKHGVQRDITRLTPDSNLSPKQTISGRETGVGRGRELEGRERGGIWVRKGKVEKGVGWVRKGKVEKGVGWVENGEGEELELEFDNFILHGL